MTGVVETKGVTKLVVDTTATKEWMTDAECLRGHDPELWFPAIENGASRKGQQAIAICDACSVAPDCYLYALELISNGAVISGIWAGRFVANVSKAEAKLITRQNRRHRESSEPGRGQ